MSIVREPEGDPPGEYQAATPVTLTCTHNGSSSATYSWTCSGESNCFTQGLTQPWKRRGILRGGDTGIHTCTIDRQGMSGTGSTNITVTGKFVFFWKSFFVNKGFNTKNTCSLTREIQKKTD